jgi:hypothetical protein
MSQTTMLFTATAVRTSEPTGSCVYVDAAIVCLWVVERDWQPATQVDVASTVSNSTPFLLRCKGKQRAGRAMNDLPQVKLTAAIDSQGSAASPREENITKRIHNKKATDIDKGTKRS